MTKPADEFLAERSETLQIGGRLLPRDGARDYATRYLTRGHGFAYPSYDGYQRDLATGPLVDGDLLAPVLLNVRHLGVDTYEALRRRKASLQRTLDEIPVDLDL